MNPISLGKYQLLKRIAAGGMAEIFVAKVTGISGFEKIVVVKRILPQLATNKEFIQMFLDEARIAATLHHPNIVQMYDIGAVDGNYFISMEYLHGEDVRTLMKALRSRSEGLPLEHALGIVIGLSSGLHYAHEKVGFDGHPLGIVHRDVTPQNIFITYDGSIKIVDFGIAKATNRLGETRYGTLKGKIPYMSPEQCRSEPLDRRSDVYAIGIILYELTTGFRLYKGQSEFEIMKRIVEGSIATPTSLRPTFPKDLEPIVMKALAKTKEERYATAQELQADLEAFAREHRLAVSSIALASFMAKVFGQKLEAWREAQAAGKDLATHIAERSFESSLPGSDRGVSHGSGPELVDEDDDGHPGAASAGEETPRAGELAPVAQVRRRTWAFAAAALFGLAVVGVVAWVSQGGPSSAQGGPAPTRDAALAVERPPPAPDAAPEALVPPAPDAAEETAPIAFGLIKITTHPSGAIVTIDDQEWAERTPTVVDGVTPGEHKVKVRVRGYADGRMVVKVRENETHPVAFELKPERAVVETPTPPAGEGELRIASTPSCEVLVNGKSKGFTNMSLKLPAGKYTVQLVNSRFGIDQKYSVEVRAGQVTKKKYDFPVKPQ